MKNIKESKMKKTALTIGTSLIFVLACSPMAMAGTLEDSWSKGVDALKNMDLSGITLDKAELEKALDFDQMTSFAKDLGAKIQEQLKNVKDMADGEILALRFVKENGEIALYLGDKKIEMPAEVKEELNGYINASTDKVKESLAKVEESLKSIDANGNFDFKVLQGINWNEPMTREVFVDYMAKFLKLPLDQDYKEVFKDVKIDSQYGKAIYAVYNAGLISGTEVDKFSPKSYISPEQMYNILERICVKYNIQLPNLISPELKAQIDALGEKVKQANLTKEFNDFIASLGLSKAEVDKIFKDIDILDLKADLENSGINFNDFLKFIKESNVDVKDFMAFLNETGLDIEDVMDMVNKTGMSLKDIEKALEKTGLDYNDLMKLVKSTGLDVNQIMKMAGNSSLNLNDVNKILDKAGMNLKDVSKMLDDAGITMDQLIYASEKTGLSIDKILVFIFTPGLSFEDFLGLFAF